MSNKSKKLAQKANRRRLQKQAEEKLKKKLQKEIDSQTLWGEKYNTGKAVNKYKCDIPEWAKTINAGMKKGELPPIVSYGTKGKSVYYGELAEREKLAQEEIQRKRMRVAPAYSKGAYQYITEETDLTDLGRKK